MNRRDLLSGTACMMVTTSSGCALIFSGAKGPSERGDGILWGWLICDLLWGVWPLVIDLATGALWVRKSSETSEVEAWPAEMCPEAQLALSSIRRTRHAAMYLQDHLPHCDHCVAAITIAHSGPTTDLTEMMESSEPDVVEEVVVIDV